MRASNRFACFAAGALAVLALGPTAANAWQDGPRDKEQAALVEEQELLARKLNRLLGSMERLAERFEAEGRVHAAQLLRDGLTHARRRGEAEQNATLEELMTGAEKELDVGQGMQSIETQERIVADLDRLLSILMDRPDLDELEDQLEQLRRLKAELSGLIDDEQKLEEATDALREQIAGEEQRALEEGIAAAIEAQRKLLEKNEREARASGSLDLEKLERALAELLDDQHTDASVMESWMPRALPPLEALLPELQAARRANDRAKRLEGSGEALKQAAAESASDAEEPAREQAVRDLQERAAQERRAARASGDPSASRSAEALERAASRLHDAGGDPEARRDAAAEVGELAARLGEEAEAAEREAAEKREAVRERLQALAKEEGEGGELAREVERELAAASEGGSEAENAIERAIDQLARGIDDLKFLGQALAASQRQNADRAEQIREGLGRLPGSMSEETSGAREDLERARDAMQEASDRATEEEPVAAREAAKEAEDALREALAALGEARESGEAEQRAAAELAGDQERLAEDVEALEDFAEQAALDEEAEASVRESLEQAAEAMRGASSEMRRGKRGSAARQQRSASESLKNAAKAAREGVTPETPEDRARAEELAREQERIEKELYEFLQRWQEREDSRPLPSIDGAQESAKKAQESLQQGALDEARQQEEEAERQMKQALAELEDEEEQYQELRDEELLFKVAEEVATILEEHRAAAEETLEVDATREPGETATRGQKLRLRKISRQEEALADRAAEIEQALREEESVVFAELTGRIDHDLRRAARELGESGGYRSDDRVQALQDDVTGSLEWLQTALEEEKQRREEGGEPPPQRQPGQNRLVPDVAELKLLARMERDVLDSIDELLVLYPELREAEGLDPLLLEEIGTLAHRHERTTELFAKFRGRLGLPEPGPGLSESEVPPDDGGSPEDETDAGSAGSEDGDGE